jgi:hypothetical protein
MVSTTCMEEGAPAAIQSPVVEAPTQPPAAGGAAVAAATAPAAAQPQRLIPRSQSAHLGDGPVAAAVAAIEGRRARSLKVKVSVGVDDLSLQPFLGEAHWWPASPLSSCGGAGPSSGGGGGGAPWMQ